MKVKKLSLVIKMIRLIYNSFFQILYIYKGIYTVYIYILQSSVMMPGVFTYQELVLWSEKFVESYKDFCRSRFKMGFG